MAKESKIDIEARRDIVYHQVVNEKGISKIVNKQLFALAVLGVFCNSFTWVFWVRQRFERKGLLSFFWFVLMPFIAQTLCLVFLEVYRLVDNSRKSEYTNGRKIATMVFGSLFYTLFFTTIISLYRDIPVFWLFAICPILTVSIYSDFRWLLCTLSYTFIAMIMVISGVFYKPEFSLSNSPVMMMVLEAVIIAAIVALFVSALHTKTATIIKDVSKIEATTQAKNMFFAKISHEIRTPINAVLGMDELILREGNDKKIEEYAMNIKEAGQTLLSLINDILDTSKLEAGKLELTPGEYDLMNVLADAYNMIKLRAENKGLKLTVINDPSIPRNLYGDEVRIRQILVNIFSNAVKYTQVGSVEVEVSWHKLDNDEMKLIVKVSDTGIGISENDLPRLFDSFERFDEEKNKYTEGTGLGLSITKQLIDLMKGEIKVESTVGKGSVFTVFIPQTICGMSSLGDFNKNLLRQIRPKEDYKQKFVASKAKILVVDDVQMNIDVIKGLLKKTEITIDAALSGKEAIEKVEKEKYDIILMDHLMPEMDGIETYKYMRSHKIISESTPAIVVTANTDASAQDAYKAAGFSEYMPKPVKGKVLEETIYKYLSKEVLEEDDNKEEHLPEVKNTDTSNSLISKLDFLDTEMGLSNCMGDEELYSDVLKSFKNESRVISLSKHFQAKNWEEYMVQAHALKSTSLSIGAVDLSDKAKALEVASKEKDVSFIEAHHSEMMHDYEKLLNKIASVFPG